MRCGILGGVGCGNLHRCIINCDSAPDIDQRNAPIESFDGLRFFDQWLPDSSLTIRIYSWSGLERLSSRHAMVDSLKRAGTSGRNTTPSCGSPVIYGGTSATPNPSATKRMAVGAFSASCKILAANPASWQVSTSHSREPGWVFVEPATKNCVANSVSLISRFLARGCPE